jgi:hypothetical protein
MKKLFYRLPSPLFAITLVVLFLTFLYPQTGRAQDCWWCDPPPPINNEPGIPDFSWGFSPGFDLLVCFDRRCVESIDPLSSLAAPNVTIRSSGCVKGTPSNITIAGTAICAAGNDGKPNLNSVAQCDVSITVLGASCDLDANNFATYSRIQGNEPPTAVFHPDSKIAIGEPRVGWPCDATGPCVFPIGTQSCTSNGPTIASSTSTPACATSYPATGDGKSFNSLNAGQVLKGVQKDNFLALRACKGLPASPVSVSSSVNGASSILCVENGNVLTGGGTSSVGVVCPKGDWVGGDRISPNPQNHGFDLFGDTDCVLGNIIESSVELNGVPNPRCQTQQGGKRIRCFFDEGAVYTASGCTDGKEIRLVATGNIVVAQGGGTVTVPFYTHPGDPVTCQK